MAEQGFHESVVKADKWSKPIALVVAIAVFLLANRLTAAVQFSSIIAAAVGIGTRFYVPYHASVRVPEPDRIPLHEHPVTGSYHHGAAGLSLVVASFVALGVFLLVHGFLTAIGVGVIFGVVLYFVFSWWILTD